MSDDLIERLRHAHEHSQQRIVGSNIFQEAATALEAKDAEIERLRLERDDALLLASKLNGQKDLQDMMKLNNEFAIRAEQAERALAEAVKVVESLLLSLSNNSSERVKAARQFVKEHSANAGQ